jgi:hypothetical protein
VYALDFREYVFNLNTRKMCYKERQREREREREKERERRILSALILGSFHLEI